MSRRLVGRTRTGALALMLVVGPALPARAWSDPVFVSANGGPQSSLAVSPKGAVAVAYLGLGDLVFRQRRTASWKEAVVIDHGFVACYDDWEPSVAFAMSGVPSVIDTCDNEFITGTPTRGELVQVGTRRSGAWDLEPTMRQAVDPIGCNDTIGIDLALQPTTGRPAVIESDATGSVRFTRKTKAGWSPPEAVPTDGITTTGCLYGALVTLAYDPSKNEPLVAMTDRFDAGELRLARRSGGVWTNEPVAIDAVGLPSIAVAGDGSIWIAYQRRTSGGSELAVSTKSPGGTWTTSTVDGSVARTGLHPDVALLGSLPRIAYRDQTNKDLRYASFDGVAWTLTTVQSRGSVGTFPSLAIDALGEAHLSYYEGRNSSIQYLHGPA